MAKKTPRLLLVEDDADHVEILTLVFEGEGYEVETVRDGQQALEVMADNSFSLVICDYMMPRLNGQEFVKQLRGKKFGKSIPVLMLTSVAGPVAKETFLYAGANDFVSKCSSKSEILERVRQLL